MFERHQGGEVAVLVHVEFTVDTHLSADLRELHELALSAGAELSAVVTAAKAHPDAKYFVGSGKAEDIREVVPLDFPVSSFDLNPGEIREIITGLDPVASATVRIRPGGILQIDVTERLPVVVWRTWDGVEVLDATGAHVADLPSRATRSDLPLIAGRGADKHVDEALRLIAASRPLGDRLRGLSRIGERRWDVVLDRGQRILLPVEAPVHALERVLALNEVQDLLERDVAAVDMRLGERPTIRMSENAVQEWWTIRKINGSGQ